MHSWYSAAHTPQPNARRCTECGCTNYDERWVDVGGPYDPDHHCITDFACGASIDFAPPAPERINRCLVGDTTIRKAVTLRDWLHGFIEVTIPKEMRR